MLDLSLFRKPAFVGVSIVAFGLSASMFSMFLYITIYMQDILGYGPLEAGVRFLPLTIVAFFAAPIAGRLLTRIPARAFFGAGLTLVGIGLLLMGGLSADSEWTALLAGFLIAGAGIGMTNPAIASVAVGVVPPEKAGMGSGINNTFRQVGIATGIAGFGAIFQHGIESRLVEDGAPEQLGEAVASSGTRAAEGGAPQLLEIVQDAFIGSLNELFLIGGIVALAAAALGLLLTREGDLIPHGPE
jgi:predicted MFS family arabinose efflux permease